MLKSCGVFLFFIVLNIVIGCSHSSPQFYHLLWGRYRTPEHQGSSCIHGLCKSSSEYPQEKIQYLAQMQMEFEQYFGNVIKLQADNFMELDDRFGADEKPENLCKTLRYTIFPKVARNEQNRTKLVVNAGKYKQGLAFETCVPGASCLFNDLAPNHINMTCQQQFHVVRLVSLSDDEQLEFDNFPIPSNCVCSYIST